MQAPRHGPAVEPTPTPSRARWIHLGLGAIAGGLLSGAKYWYEGRARELAAAHRWAELDSLTTSTLRGGAIVSLIVAIAVCLPCAMYAGRVLIERRWPLSEPRAGATVLRGRSAVVRGLLIFVVSVSLGALTLYSGVLLWQSADGWAAIARTRR